MSDPLPPDPARLHTIARYLELQLAAVHTALAAAEQRPWWWVQWARRRKGEARHGLLHQEGCWRPGEPTLTAEQVRVLLAEHGDRIIRCDICRPEQRQA
ncbi:DUF6233 domain-containing protein [Streptomyces sp. 6N223]|uniref:DUF6233 domain-containing protein n=1 Tax=Streptomyces sp. 6N223 TaxID=3457412 RepID=UPI003FD1F697